MTTSDRGHDRQGQRDDILVATLPHVAFDGWTRRALCTGVTDAGHGADMADRAFPGGIADLIEHYSNWADRCMVATLDEMDLETLRVRDRVADGVRARITAVADHPEAVRRAVALLAMPQNAPLAARCTWRTVDTIWYAAGDRSADFNHYTKRGLLAPVYGATVLYWLADQSEGAADTWHFLDRRLDDVLKVPRLGAKLREVLASAPNPFRRFRPGT
jgi:ubiquinone biosynthesis protein COQ9